MNPLTFDPSPIEKGPRIRIFSILPPWTLVPIGLFLARFYTLSLSSFGWYHGFNEAVYTEIAANYEKNLWIPTRGGVPFFDTGPFTTYLMYASGHFLGWTEEAMRFAVLIAYPVAVWAAYQAGQGFYGRGKGRIAALLVASSPWVLLWFGRAQTDAWMTAGILLFLAGIAKPQGARGAALIISGLVIGFLSKQPALLCLIAVPILYPPPRDKDEIAKLEFRATGKRVWVLTLIGVVVGLAWWFAMSIAQEVAFESAKEFHLHNRAAPFGNWAWTLVLGLLVGSGALAGFAWKARKPNPALAVLAGGYALFAISNSPVGHEYYALPAVAVLAVMAANWKWSRATLAACVAGSVLLTVPLLGFTGDLDDHQSRQMGHELSALVPANATVLGPDRLVPQLELYSGRTVQENGTEDATVGAFIISWDSQSCPGVAKTAKTLKNPPLRLFDCRRSLDVSETVDGSVFLS